MSVVSDSVPAGDSGVGKSSLIAVLSEGQFSSSIKSTVGLDYTITTLGVGEERVVFQLWDTAGQERYVEQNALQWYTIVVSAGSTMP